MRDGYFQIEEDPFAKNAQGIAKGFHEVFLLMKVLQTKSQVTSMNIKYYYYFLIYW